MTAQPTEEYNKLYQTLQQLANTSQPVAVKDLLEPKRAKRKEKQGVTASVMSSLFGQPSIEENALTLPKAEDLTCPACKTIFPTRHLTEFHLAQNRACAEWIALPASEAIPDLPRALPEMIQEWLEESLCVKPLECRHCGTISSSKAAFHKHFQKSVSCNRLAHRAFMKHLHK
jgi:hypothetical protein